MFRKLIYPSSGARDCVVELPHRSSCSQFVVCWRFVAAGFEWCSFCRLKHNYWAHNKWNKIASDIKLVFHSSTIAMMHGPINIRFTEIESVESRRDFLTLNLVARIVTTLCYGINKYPATNLKVCEVCFFFCLDSNKYGEGCWWVENSSGSLIIHLTVRNF